MWGSCGGLGPPGRRLLVCGQSRGRTCRLYRPREGPRPHQQARGARRGPSAVLSAFPTAHPASWLPGAGQGAQAGSAGCPPVWHTQGQATAQTGQREERRGGETPVELWGACGPRGPVLQAWPPPSPSGLSPWMGSGVLLWMWPEDGPGVFLSHWYPPSSCPSVTVRPSNPAQEQGPRRPTQQGQVQGRQPPSLVLRGGGGGGGRGSAWPDSDQGPHLAAWLQGWASPPTGQGSATVTLLLLMVGNWSREQWPLAQNPWSPAWGVNWVPPSLFAPPPVLSASLGSLACPPPPPGSPPGCATVVSPLSDHSSSGASQQGSPKAGPPLGTPPQSAL